MEYNLSRVVSGGVGSGRFGLVLSGEAGQNGATTQVKERSDSSTYRLIIIFMNIAFLNLITDLVGN